MLRLMPHPLQFAFQSAGPLPARSLSCRLCRDASSPLPPSSDVGKFIRGAAFPTARAGLRRPQMRSAALFRPSDGFSARPGNVAAPCGGVHSGSGNEPPARSLSDRLCRDASSSLPPSPDVGEFIRGAAFPIARAGLRRPQMRSAAEYSRPAALFRAPDGLSARPGNVAAPCGGAFRLRQRTARAELVRSALPGRIVFSPAFSGCRKIHPGHRLSDRPCGIAASADAFRGGVLPPLGPLSPARRIFGTPRHVAAPCGGVHSGSGDEPPARSLSDRLCRDASSSLPPSPDVGEFIRGAAFPIARAGLRRPQMRSAAEYSRPAALFRAPDGLSARPGMSPPRAAGGIPAPATNRPRGACPVGFAGTHRLLSRLLRMSENSSGGTAFPIARAGLRCPQMRPAALFRPSDGFSARPGMSPPRAAGGGIPAPATNRPRRTAPEVRRPRAPQLRPYSSPEAPSPSRCVPFARSAKFARAQPAAFARIMRYARPLRMFACSETAPHET